MKYQSNNNHILSFFPGKESEPNFIGSGLFATKLDQLTLKKVSMGTEDMSFSKLNLKGSS